MTGKQYKQHARMRRPAQPDAGEGGHGYDQQQQQPMCSGVRHGLVGMGLACMSECMHGGGAIAAGFLRGSKGGGAFT